MLPSRSGGSSREQGALLTQLGYAPRLTLPSRPLRKNRARDLLTDSRRRPPCARVLRSRPAATRASRAHVSARLANLSDREMHRRYIAPDTDAGGIAWFGF